jgi:hypothetical protein
MWTHPDAIIRYRASDMILNVHSDASCLAAPTACSSAGGYFFLGSIPHNGEPIKLNGAIHITCAILKLVAAFAAEAELGTLFLNAQEANVLQLILQNLAIHNRPPQYTLTTQQQLELSTTPSNAKDHKQWRCDICGYWMAKHNDTSNSTTNLTLKT